MSLNNETRRSSSPMARCLISLLGLLPVSTHNEAGHTRLTSITVYSGARAFELLDEEERKFTLNTKVRYAPRAYEWILNCKATDDALTIAKVGREKNLSELPEWTWDKVHTFPVSFRLLPTRKEDKANCFRWSGRTPTMAHHTCKYLVLVFTSYIRPSHSQAT
jgi:hypothetical protein